MIEARGNMIVVGVEPFLSEDTFDCPEGSLLKNLLSDVEIHEQVSGLWVPKHILDNPRLGSVVSSLAIGAPNIYGYGGDNPTYRVYDDESLSGGVDDTIEHIKSRGDNYPSLHTTYSVSESGYTELFKALDVHAGSTTGYELDFMMATLYPENCPEAYLEDYGRTAEECTEKCSELAQNYEGFVGVVGAADLMPSVPTGLEFLALGVEIEVDDLGSLATQDKRDAVSEQNSDEVRVFKRRTPMEDFAKTIGNRQNVAVVLGSELMKGGVSQMGLDQQAEEVKKRIARAYRAINPITVS